MSDVQVGAAYVDVLPDMDRFAAELAAGLEAATRSARVSIGIDADMASFMASLEAGLAAARAKAVSIPITVDASRAAAGLAAARTSLGAAAAASDLSMNLGVDDAGVATGLAAAEASGRAFSSEEFDAKLGFKVDYDSLIAALAAARTTVGATAIGGVLAGGSPYNVDAKILAALSQAHTSAGASAIAQDAGIAVADKGSGGFLSGLLAGRGGGGGIKWPLLLGAAAAGAGAFAPGFGALGGLGIPAAMGVGGGTMAMDLLGLSIPHLIMTGVSLASAAGGGLLGGGLLGLGSLGVAGVGMGTDLAGMGQALGDIKSVNQVLTQAQTAKGAPSTAGYQAAEATYTRALVASGPGSRTSVADWAKLTASADTYANALLHSAGAQQQLNQLLQHFSPIAAGAVTQAAVSVQAFKILFDGATGQAEKTGAQIINQAIHVGEHFLPTIGEYATKNMGIIQHQLQPFFSWLQNAGAQGGLGIFTNLEAIFTKNLPTSIHAMEQGFELLLKVIDIAAQHTGGFMASLDKFFTKWNDPSNFSGLKSHMDKLFSDFKILENFLKAGYDLIMSFVHADAQTGQAIFQNLTQAMQKLSDWINTVGHSQVHNLLIAHRDQTLALIGALEHLIGGAGAGAIHLFTVLSRAMVPVITALGNDLVPMTNALTGALAPLVVQSLPALIPLMDFLAKAITGVIHALSWLIDGLNHVPFVGRIAAGFISLGLALAAFGRLGVVVSVLQGIGSALRFLFGGQVFTTIADGFIGARIKLIDFSESLAGLVFSEEAVAGASEAMTYAMAAVSAVGIAAVAVGVYELIHHFGVLPGLIYSGIAALGALTVAMIIFDSVPIVAVIAAIGLAIAGLAAGITELVNHWDSVVAFLQGPWGTAISGALAVLVPFIGVPMLLIGHWSGVVSFFENLWGAVKHVFQDGVSVIGHVILAILDIGSHLPFVGGQFASAASAVRGYVAAIDGAGVKTAAAATAIDALPPKLRGVSGGFGAIASTGGPAALAMSEITGATNNANSALNTYNSIVDILVGNNLSAQSSLNQTRQDLATLADQAKNTSGSLSGTDSASLNLQSTVISFSRDLYSSLIPALANSGQSTSQITSQVQGLVGQFNAQLKAMGLTPAAIAAVDAQYGLTNPVLATAAQNAADIAKNANDAKGGLAALSTPVTIHIDYSQLGAAAQAARNLASLLGTDLTTAASVQGAISKQHFAVGGLVTKPTLAVVGEAGPEAILPLSDMRRSMEILRSVGLGPTTGGPGMSPRAITPSSGFVYQGGPVSVVLPAGTSASDTASIKAAVEQAMKEHDAQLIADFHDLGVIG